MEAKATPYAVVYSLFGGYVLPRGGEIWMGSLIRALAALNFSERVVRTTVSRMKQTGYLQSRRVGRRSFYWLTDPGVKEVQRAGNLAFTPSSAEWDGRWTMVTYSIPEEQRELRDALRVSLRMVGFGPLVPGAWVSPHPLHPDVERRWQEIGVWHYLEIFRVEHVGPSDVSGFVANVWPQLPALAGHYLAYEKKYERVLKQCEKEALSNEECFALRLRSLFDFIAIILQDPGLPLALLPKDWPRPAALSLHRKVRHTLAEPAEHFFDEIYKTSEAFDR
jgi:phenylacetic acid degradation operon negative regulatory protein